jgi:hypothetical protein
MISPNGHVIVHPTGSISSPSSKYLQSLNINGTNISVLYQSKADMTNYITSGTLTNYVNITGNQTITGKKTLTGGINTKSQTVSGATDLNDDILFGVVKVVGSGNIRLPSPVDNAGGRISFYFESDCQLSTPSGVFSGTIASGGSALPITVASFGRHLEAYSDGTNWIIMRSSGDTASITATSLRIRECCQH